MTASPRADRLRRNLASVESALAALSVHDPLGRLSLEAFREELVSGLEREADHTAHTAHVELTLGGEPVTGGTGIDAAFLAGAVGGLYDLITRTGPRGHTRIAVTGFSFEPARAVLEEVDEMGDLLFPSPLRRAVTAVIDHLHDLAHGSDDDFGDMVESVEPRVLMAMRDFIGRLAGRQGTLVVAQSSHAVQLDAGGIDRAWRRLEATRVDEAPLKLTGRLLGLIPLGRRFEFQPETGHGPIAGRVAEPLATHYVTHLDTAALAGRRWSALLERVTVERPGQKPTERYTLIELEPAGV